MTLGVFGILIIYYTLTCILRHNFRETRKNKKVYIKLENPDGNGDSTYFEK